MSEILARVFRGGILESMHRGSIAIVEPDSRCLARIGNPETNAFWRSAAKSFQFIPFLSNGFGNQLSKQEIALACASHSGEDYHVRAAAAILKKYGFSEADLQCGSQYPFDDDARLLLYKNGIKPTQLHNNCSGKHAVMLAFANRLGAPTSTYLSSDNQIQHEIVDSISRFTKVPRNDLQFGVDGCSAPNFALPISGMALAFANLVAPSVDFPEQIRVACNGIVEAQLRYPKYVGGNTRLDTKIMQALPGKIVSKIGAEGIWCAGILPCEKYPNGLGIALKIEDGDDQRARPVVAIEILRQLGIMTNESELALGEFSPSVLRNLRKKEVGFVKADFSLSFSSQ